MAVADTMQNYIVVLVYLLLLHTNGSVSLIVHKKVSKVSENQVCDVLGQYAVKSCTACLLLCENNPECEKISCKKSTFICILCSTQSRISHLMGNIYDNEQESFRTTIDG